MKPVTQTVFGEGKGNCFAACIASILELPIDEVPNFCGDYGDAWWGKTQEWLSERGLFGIDFTIHRFEDGGWFAPVPSGTHFIVTGKSPRGDFLHCVVARFSPDGQFELVHDPHPSCGLLAGPPVAVMFLGTTNPEAVIRRAS